MEGSKGLTVQELCDKLTTISHNGQAQAEVRHCSGFEVLPIIDVKMIGDTVALLVSKGAQSK